MYILVWIIYILVLNTGLRYLYCQGTKQKQGLAAGWAGVAGMEDHVLDEGDVLSDHEGVDDTSNDEVEAPAKVEDGVNGFSPQYSPDKRAGGDTSQADQQPLQYSG